MQFGPLVHLSPDQQPVVLFYVADEAGMSHLPVVSLRDDLVALGLISAIYPGFPLAERLPQIKPPRNAQYAFGFVCGFNAACDCSLVVFERGEPRLPKNFRNRFGKYFAALSPLNHIAAPLLKNETTREREAVVVGACNHSPKRVLQVLVKLFALVVLELALHHDAVLVALSAHLNSVDSLLSLVRRLSTVADLALKHSLPLRGQTQLPPVERRFQFLFLKVCHDGPHVTISVRKLANFLLPGNEAPLLAAHVVPVKPLLKRFVASKSQG